MQPTGAFHEFDHFDHKAVIHAVAGMMHNVQSSLVTSTEAQVDASTSWMSSWRPCLCHQQAAKIKVMQHLSGAHAARIFMVKLNMLCTGLV